MHNEIAHDRILAWCRSGKRGIGQPVMRLGAYGLPCAVIDLSSSEPKPGGFEWETRSKVVASGETWEECLGVLLAQGREL